MVDQATRFIAAGMMGIAAFFGFVWTIYIVGVAVTSGVSDITTFTAIGCFRAAANLFAICGYLYWELPCTVFGRRGIDVRINHFVTTTMANMYTISQIMLLLQVLDRIFIYTIKKHYTRYVSPIIIAVIFSALVGWRIYVVMNIYQDGCLLIYDEETLGWLMYPDRCEGYFYEGDLLTANVVLYSGVVLHIFCIVVIVVLKAMRKGSSQKIRHTDVLLYIQTVVQQLLFVIDLTCMMYVGPKVAEIPILGFVCFTYTGELVHVFDGFFMLLFQQKLLEPVKKLFNKEKRTNTMLFL